MKKQIQARGRSAGAMRRRTLPVLVAGCFGAGLACANPVGPQVVAGQAVFASQGNILSITNSPGAIINWQGFSIGQGEITRFIQQNAGSAVLNRVTGQDPSQILGALQSNGRVFLVNPNGILFGPGAQIDVNGLVASTLNIANEDFLAGRLRFAAGDKAGDLNNQGSITTPSGGTVYLIAPNVENSGIITSPQGEVLLAAGRSVQLVDSADPALQVVVSAPEDRALNLGSVIVQGGKAGIYGALINQRGLVSADSAVVGENGKIVFKASGDTLLEAGSRTSATGAGSGGEIQVLGRRVALSGDAQVDASGRSGGGTVLVGGGYQGEGDAMHAQRSYVGADAEIRADAIDAGDGGKVVVWSDQGTQAYGRISARGGRQGGNGGTVETSGHYLDVAGLRVDAGADAGRNGNWLLDPYDIEVINGGSATLTNFDQFADPPGSGTSQVSAAAISGATADVTLQATHDITFTDAVNIAAASVGLTAQAGNSINVNNSITTNGGAITLRANDAGGPASGSGAVNLNGALNSNGGFITLNGASIALNGTGSIFAGSSAGIQLSADDMSLAGTLKADNVTLMPNTAGRPIDLGTDTAGKLGLTAAELNNITANRVAIGNSASGAITITAPLTSNFASLSLISGGAITQNAGATLGGGLSLRLEGSSVYLPEANPTGVIAGRTTSGDFEYRSSNGIAVSLVDDVSGISVPGSANIKLTSDLDINQSAPLSGGGLALRARYGVSLTNSGNSFSRVVADLYYGGSGGGDLSLFNSGDLVVGGSIAVGGSPVVGITTNAMPVTLRTGAYHTLTISEPIATGTDTNSHVDLQADKLVLNNTVTASEVSIRPYSGGRPITVGSTTCHDLDSYDGSCLSVTGLSNVAAATIGIGRDGSDSGGSTASVGSAPGSTALSGPIYVEGITVGSGALTDRNAATTRIGLLSGAGVSQGSALGIDVQDLGAIAGGTGSVNLVNSANRVSNLAGSTGGGGFAFADAIDLNVTTLAGDAGYGGSAGYMVPGINAGSGSVSLRSAGAINGGLVSGASLNLNAGGGIALATSVGSLSVVNSGGSGDVFIANGGVGAPAPLALQGATQNGSGSIGIVNYGHLQVLGPVSTGSGIIALFANSPLTVGSTISSSSGDIFLSAGATGTPGAGDTLTIGSSGFVRTGGAVVLAAGDGIVIANPANISSGSGSVLQLANLNVSGADPCTNVANCVSNLPFSSNPTFSQAANTAVNTIVTTTPITALLPASTSTGASGTAPLSTQSDGGKGEEKKDDKTGSAGTQDNGAKKNEAVKKNYCN